MIASNQMSKYCLTEFEEYIFSPFDTNVFLELNEANLIQYNTLRNDVLNKLNNNYNIYENFSIKWEVEDNKKYKLAKGVFMSPGKNKSFIKGTIADSDLTEFTYTIDNNTECKDVNFKVEEAVFYIYEYGVGTISMSVNITSEIGVTVVEMDEVSEFINNKFRDKLLGPCKYIRDAFTTVIENKNLALSLDIFRHNRDMLDQNCIPWTHRIYHVNDMELLEKENPGEIFRFLLTPSSQIDIYDFSIYDHRYIYFGWGHSVIITNGYDDDYEQTTLNIDHYVRIVEIAQAKWQCLNNVNRIVDLELLNFNSTIENIQLKNIENTIYEIQLFSTNINSILRALDDMKITFDTEKRNLLKELNERWFVDTLKEDLTSSISEIEKKLLFLRDRKISISDGRLNTILFILTIINSIEVFVTIYNLIWNTSSTAIVSEAVFTFASTLVLLIFIVLYVNKSR